MIWIHEAKEQQEWMKWFAWHPVPIGKYPIQNGDKMIWFDGLKENG